MKGWMILLIILVVLWLISLIRLGGRVHYAPDGFTVKIIAGPARIQVVPARKEKKKKKPQKAKKPKKTKEKKPVQEGTEGDKPEEKKPGTVSRLLKLLPVVAEAAGALRRKIRIDELSMSVIWGGEDAAAVAIGYGRANALLGMIWPLLDHNFKVKKYAFDVDLDYNRQSPAIVLDAALTMTIGQLLSFAVRYGLKALMNWSRSGKSSKHEQEA